ncbi:hypothetical protein GCM10025867_30920 [Frondihabitans sucicola]|uniref:Uncharacterized protein n=1 Tax=Frondihabitans sucicola TaxID=1268041 RepID=A0ABN6Y4H2_9MICO|nr:hypothetical protein GCM10025867_30920 [Frondihabitans sucicola]
MSCGSAAEVLFDRRCELVGDEIPALDEAELVVPGAICFDFVRGGSRVEGAVGVVRDREDAGAERPSRRTPATDEGGRPDEAFPFVDDEEARAG